MRSSALIVATASAVIAGTYLAPAGNAATAAPGHPAAPVVGAAPAAASYAPECLYYADTECAAEKGALPGASLVDTIISASSAVIALISLILQGKAGSGSKKGDVIVIILNEGAENGAGGDDNAAEDNLGDDEGTPEWESGDCENDCSEYAEWIEVPTGQSYALLNYGTYLHGNLDYLTASGLSSGDSLVLKTAQSGGEDERTWYYDVAIAGPNQPPPSPSPSPSLSATK
jgi:hypothetical protein